jgi:hypothetical protein
MHSKRLQFVSVETNTQNTVFCRLLQASQDLSALMILMNVRLLHVLMELPVRKFLDHIHASVYLNMLDITVIVVPPIARFTVDAIWQYHPMHWRISSVFVTPAGMATSARWRSVLLNLVKSDLYFIQICRNIQLSAVITNAVNSHHVNTNKLTQANVHIYKLIWKLYFIAVYFLPF